jgi:mono/diheme cytochrome c family protein
VGSIEMNCSRLVFAGLGIAIAIVSAACGDDDPPKSACPANDPATRADESECAAAATVEAGKQAVQMDKRKCVSCHGQNMAGASAPLPGYGNTLLGEPVELLPPNLTPDKETGIGNWRDEQLALAIRTGVDNESQTLCPQMNHFSNMSDFEVYSIIKYLRSLPPVNNKVLRSVCPPLKTKEQQNLPR